MYILLEPVLYNHIFIDNKASGVLFKIMAQITQA
nr:hypothetical protein KV8917_910016 [Klebsiella variicola]